MTSPNTRVYLVDAVYVPEKRQVVLEFSGPSKRVSIPFTFFPCIHLSVERGAKQDLEALIEASDRKRYRFNSIRGGKVLEVRASTFEQLKKLASTVFGKKNVSNFLFEPERQFLLERNWSYFDSFEFRDGSPEKTEARGMPNPRLGFLSKLLQLSFKELAESGLHLAEEFVERIAVSNLLAIHPSAVPEQHFQRMEAFFENVFFRNRFPFPGKTDDAFQKQDLVRPKGAYADLTEIDFTPTWNALFTSRSMNIGFDTINCSCCKPSSAGEQNVSPDSLVSVEFLADGFYFESRSRTWSEAFHSQVPGKEKRLSFKREWSLNSVPAGPFFKNMRKRIPLADAVKLEPEERLRILDEGHSLNWFCRKKPGFVSKTIDLLDKRLALIDSRLSSFRGRQPVQEKLFSQTSLSQNPDSFYLRAYSALLSRLAADFPCHCLSQESKFWLAEISEVVETVRADTLCKFRDFTTSHGCKYVASNSHRAFISTDSALELVRGFSSHFKIPSPVVAERHEFLPFG